MWIVNPVTSPTFVTLRYEQMKPIPQDGRSLFTTVQHYYNYNPQGHNYGIMHTTITYTAKGNTGDMYVNKPIQQLLTVYNHTFDKQRLSWFTKIQWSSAIVDSLLQSHPLPVQWNIQNFRYTVLTHLFIHVIYLDDIGMLREWVSEWVLSKV